MVLGLSRSTSSGSLGSKSTATSTASPSGLLGGSSLRRSSSSSSLTRALTRFGQGSGLCGATNALSPAQIEKEETGHWYYLVVDAKGIRPRNDANYSKENKSQHRHAQGCIVEVERRRKSGWTTFLGLKIGGWVFDVSPKDASVRMTEVEVCRGIWTYEVCSYQQLTLLPHPAADPKKHCKAKGLQPKEVFQVHNRVRPVSGKGSYLELADGRGWVLDYADGHKTVAYWSEEGTSKEDFCVTSCDSPTTNALGAELGSPELGEWEYVVLDPKGLSLRSQPTYDSKFKISRRIEEGEIVVAHERRCGDGTTFLRLACPQGWVFDRQPGKDSRIRMMEAQLERGSWHYRVIADNGIAVRSRCSFSEATKCGKGPLKGAVIEVSLRVQVGSTTFLQMKANSDQGDQEDGRWIFDSKAGRKVLEGPLDVQVAAPGTKAIAKPETGVLLRSAPTTLSWAETKKRLLQGAKVEVLKTLVNPAGTEKQTAPQRWAYISKSGGPGGIEGWMYLDELTIEDAADLFEKRHSEGTAAKLSNNLPSSSQAVANSCEKVFHKPTSSVVATCSDKDKSAPTAACSTLRDAGTMPPSVCLTAPLRATFGQPLPAASNQGRGQCDAALAQNENAPDTASQENSAPPMRPVSVNAWSTPILSN